MNSESGRQRVVRMVGRSLRAGLVAAVRRLSGGTTTREPSAPPASRPTAPPSPAPEGHPGYPGDATGSIRIEYAPFDDDAPDPGEIVWAWVPYEEDHSRGKDRPVLVVGRQTGLLLALMLTSKDHDRDAAQEARFGRYWVDIGTGAWDRRRRPSEVRVDRVLRIDPSSVRREGAVLDRPRFAEVADGVRRARAGH